MQHAIQENKEALTKYLLGGRLITVGVGIVISYLLLHNGWGITLPLKVVLFTIPISCLFKMGSRPYWFFSGFMASLLLIDGIPRLLAHLSH